MSTNFYVAGEDSTNDNKRVWANVHRHSITMGNRIEATAMTQIQAHQVAARAATSLAGRSWLKNVTVVPGDQSGVK